MFLDFEITYHMGLHPMDSHSVPVTFWSQGWVHDLGRTMQEPKQRLEKWKQDSKQALQTVIF